MIIRGLDTADAGLRCGESMEEVSMTLRHLGLEISEHFRCRGYVMHDLPSFGDGFRDVEANHG